MKILEIKVMRGPNYWSVRTPQADTDEARPGRAGRTTHQPYSGLFGKAGEIIPTLYEHRCSEDKPGGFFHRVEEGTWMGHVIEHIALELQTIGGMDTGFGRTRGTGVAGEYYVCIQLYGRRCRCLCSKSCRKHCRIHYQ